jgi:peptide/nickel transport system substrate-binding protein
MPFTCTRFIPTLRITAFLIVALLAGCLSPGNNPNSSSITYGLTLEPSGIDPHIHQSSELGIVLRQVYDTLVYRDPATRDIVPGLATEWSISGDGLSYTFTLRPDVTFHDGSPFNAQAVGANLDRITNPQVVSQRARFMLGPYEGYDILDTHTIRINLSERHTPLLDALSQVFLGMASPTTFEQYSTNRYQFHQVGTGPYRFVEYVPGDRIVVRRNQEYHWGPEFYREDSDAAPDEIVYRFFTDPTTRALALESGEAQIMGELLPSDARALAGNSQIRLMPTAIPGQPLQFIMNTQRYPTDNLAVRRALIYATNRGVIADTVFQGFSPIAWGPLSASTLYYDRDVVGMYAHDPQQARALLASAGFEDTNNNGFLNVGEDDLEVTVIVPSWGLIPEVAQLLQSQWAEVGVRARLQPVPGFNALQDRVAAGEYNLVAFYTSGYDPAFLNEFFLSDAVNNYAHYSSSNLDNALLMAVREPSGSARRSIYGQVQRFIMEQALILPIRDYVNLNVTDLSVEDLQFDPYGWFPLLHNIRVIED